MPEVLNIADHFDPMVFYDQNRLGAERRREYSANKSAGNVWALIKCADARAQGIFPPENTALYASIAAASPSSFSAAYCHPAYSALVDFTHFDGTVQVVPPEGCGGLKEYLKLQNTPDLNPRNLRGVGSWVWDEIKTADPLQASFQNAITIARMCDKPVFFGSLDHTAAKLYIGGLAFKDQESERVLYYSPVNFEQYDPREAYAHGFPTLDPAQIPNERWARELVAINKQNEQQRQLILAANPSFSETQRVQNPSIISLSLSTLPHSLRLIFSGVAELPNSKFALSVQKNKSRDRGVTPIPSSALTQLEYPISHSVTSQDQGTGPFRDTKHMIVTTEDIEMSKDIARQACVQPYMRPWLDRGGKIMVAGVTKGRVPSRSDIALYRP